MRSSIAIPGSGRCSRRGQRPQRQRMAGSGQLAAGRRRLGHGKPEESADGQATLTIEDGGKRKLSLLLSLEPIERPAGFMLLRGREQKNTGK